MSNNYSAPASTLVNSTGNGGSLEAGIAGDYDFRVMETLSDAWSLTKGIKRYIIGAGIVMYIAIAVLVGLLSAFSLLGMGGDSGPASMLIMQLVLQPLMMAVMMPFVGGIVIICLKHIQGQPVSFGDLFSALGKTGPLLLAAILINIMVMLGFLVFIIPGIYLGVSYILVVPLILDRDLGIWEAMETSRKAITKSWFRVFGLYLLLLIIMMLSMIPLGIGLLWTVPLMAVSFMVMYQKMFGIASY